MKTLILLTFAFLSNHVSAQITAFVKNSATNKAIPYANIWVENENTGTSADKTGKFTLSVAGHSQTLVVSAIGYETRKIPLEIGIETIYLVYKPINIDEVIVTPRMATTLRRIGTFDKSDIDGIPLSASFPLMYARFFSYKEEYGETPYLKSIAILTDSRIRNAKFNVRLNAIGDNGGPGDYLYNENIFGYARKGKRITEVDLSHLNIQFPENGFFVAIECLAIEENMYEENVNYEGKKLTSKRIAPFIGTYLADSNENSWQYYKGNWTIQTEMNFRPTAAFESKIIFKGKKYNLIAMELVLTD